MKALAYGIVRYGIVPTLLGAGLATLLLACAGANGDSPTTTEAGADAGPTVIVVDCTDGATE